MSQQNRTIESMLIACSASPMQRPSQTRSRSSTAPSSSRARLTPKETTDQSNAAVSVFGSAPAKAVPVNEQDRAKGTKRGREEEEEQEESEDEDAEMQMSESDEE